MKNTVFQKRIPTVLGLLLLGVGVFVTTFLAKTGSNFLSHAGPTASPANITISNVTATGFTVFYTTAEATSGSLKYGADQSLGKLILDDRDQKTLKPSFYRTHHITVANLAPKTTYYFAVVSGDNTYLTSGSPYVVQTLPPPTEPLSIDILKGELLLPDGSVSTDAITYITIDNYTISAAALPDGSYILPFFLLEANHTGSPIQYSPLTLYATNGLLQTHITVTLGNTITALPPVTLSQEYDFTASQSGQTTPIDMEPTIQTAQLPVTPGAQTNQVLSLKQNESFVDQQPQFNGNAQPNSPVTIVIHSAQTVSQTVLADSSGTWQYRPSAPLTPGTHTITVTARNAAGILQTITQSFVVYAEGSQFVNPSVSPTQPLSTISSTPGLAGTVSPTGIIFPTGGTSSPTVTIPASKMTTPTTIPSGIFFPSLTSSITLTPTSTVSPLVLSQMPSLSTTPGSGKLPISGSDSLLLGIAASIAAVTGGIFLFLFSHGGPL